MYNNQKQKSQKKLYPKILFSFTISITLTILLLSTVLYLNFQAIVLKATTSFVKDNLAQVSYSGTLMNKTASSILMQLNIDNNIRNLLYDYLPDNEQLTFDQNRLNSYVSVNPFIQSIYVYNRFNKTFYDSGINAISAHDFYDKEIIYILDNFQKYQILKPIPRVINNNTLNSDSGIKSNVYTYIFYDKQLNTSDYRLDKAIVVNINEDFIKDMINAMSSDKRNEIYIVDNNGALIQTNTSIKMLSNINDKSFIQNIIKDSHGQGSFIDTNGNNKSLVTYTSSNVLNWKFICVTPYEIVMDKVNYMKNKVIIICFILFSLGILTSYILTKKINSPIKYMQNDLRALQIEQQRNLIIQKQVFFKVLLQSDVSSSLDKTVATLNQYETKLDPYNNFQVMVLRIDNYFEFCNKNNFSDRSLLKFAIMNISSEICEAHFKNETVDLDDDHVVIIVNASDTLIHLQLLKDISSSIIDATEKYLNLSISISISSMGSSILELHTKYIEALDSAQYRVYSGSKSILMYQDIIQKHSNVFSYPIQKENKLIDSLMLGNIEEVESIFNEILNTTINYSYKSFNLTLLRLTTAIHIAVDNFEKNSSYLLEYDFSKFIMELNKLEFLDDIRKHFSSLFEYIYNKLIEKKDTKYDELITKVIEMINSHYSDNNLSMDSIADAMGISPSYLGKLFKKFTSDTLSDYIMQTRLEASKQMLASTDYSVDKITEKIGLSYSNYFYKIFKKTYGITPNEYKQNISQHKT